jgi:NADPH:quinone reductase
MSASSPGVFLDAELATDRVRNNIQRQLDKVACGELGILIDRSFPLAEASSAHAYIEIRQTVRRVLLIP